MEIEDIAISFSGLSSELVAKLLDEFGSARCVYDAYQDGVYQYGSENNVLLKPRDRKRLLDRTHFQLAEQEIEYARSKNIRVITYNSDDYPDLLRQCCDAPSVLYVLGDIDFNGCDKWISIVGTRNNTPYGRIVTEKIVSDIALHYKDCVVVSGLANGIDAIAHKAALDNGLKTVAVLAHGLDTIYPANNRNLAIEIIRNGGALVSEFPHGTSAFKQNFLQRNRIVAGMTLATIVGESPMRSGSLATANLACNYDREVFAFPGRVSDVTYEGNNQLIRTSKATLLQSLEDIEYVLGWSRELTVLDNFVPDLLPDETKIYEVLSDGMEHSDDEIMEKTELSPSIFSSTITMMELNGLVHSIRGRMYVKS